MQNVCRIQAPVNPRIIGNEHRRHQPARTSNRSGRISPSVSPAATALERLRADLASTRERIGGAS